MSVLLSSSSSLLVFIDLHCNPLAEAAHAAVFWLSDNSLSTDDRGEACPLCSDENGNCERPSWRGCPVADTNFSATVALTASIASSSHA